MKTCKVKIDHLLSITDKQKLWSLSYDQTKIYNAALQYTKENSFDYKQMHLVTKDLRNNLEMSSPAKMSQNTVFRLISSWKSFLSLRKTDPNARPPTKFASTWDFQPLIFDWNSGLGFKIRDRKLELRADYKSYLSIKLPDYAIKCLEEVDFIVQEIKISIQDKNFYLSITLKDLNQVLSFNKDNWLSIDPGLTHIISLVTSDGIAIKYQNNQFKNLERQVSAIQSKMDKKKKYSKRYNKLRLKFKKKLRSSSNKNKNFQHCLTADVIHFCKENDIGSIFYGDIQTKKLTKSKTASTGLNKSTQNRGSLNRTKQFLQYKAGLNGIAFSLVNEAFTSKTNCYTGELYGNMNLGIRSVEIEPGIVIDRDINAAINIARRTLGTWSPQLSWIRDISMTEKYIVV